MVEAVVVVVEVWCGWYGGGGGVVVEVELW